MVTIEGTVGNGEAGTKMYARRGGGGTEEGEDSGRTPVPRSWILEGLFAVRGRRWGREKGRKRGAVSRYVRRTGGM